MCKLRRRALGSKPGIARLVITKMSTCRAEGPNLSPLFLTLI